MPNTFAHIGLQGPLTRGIFQGADPKWIYLGLLIPDIPWILQRAVWVLQPGVDPYDLRLYALAQSSLFVSLLLCAAFAVVSAAPWRVLGILSLNSFVHLLLDASQRKWGSGVHLLAPFSWELWSLDLFEVESIPTFALTAAGVGFMAWAWRSRGHRAVAPFPNQAPARRYGMGAIFLSAYMFLPLALTGGPEASDAHSVTTLREYEERVGRAAIFDRARLVRDGDKPRIRTWAGEYLVAEGQLPREEGTLSVRGTFVHPDTIVVTESHRHVNWPRDELSILAILIIFAIWLRSVVSGSLRRLRGAEAEP